ncbi:hypothetical protein COU76_04880 [Candidatus Peregrinibacteria bacterium CG10_big_fil_rev_8_21_14_0_10_49_10]|nr:MAG: hypothetical protein COU76_04880 [Candidatus Peregrinibacteria bacterium CG10_big_fil_rev_8_21_14_0_10_49_10]
MIDAYLIETSEGDSLRPDLQNQFFKGLHEALKCCIFGDRDVLWKEWGNGHIEIPLPLPNELIHQSCVTIREDCFVVFVDFQATVVGSGAKKTFQQEFVYTPPQPI